MLKQKYELFAVFIGRKGNDMAKKIKRFLVLVFVTFFCSLVSRGYNTLLSWKNAKQTKSIFRLNAAQAGSVCCQYGICDCGNRRFCSPIDGCPDCPSDSVTYRASDSYGPSDSYPTSYRASDSYGPSDTYANSYGPTDSAAVGTYGPTDTASRPTDTYANRPSDSYGPSDSWV